MLDRPTVLRNTGGMSQDTPRGATAGRLLRGGAAILSVLVALAAGLGLRPTPSRLPAEAQGDQALAEVARTTFGDQGRALAVAVVDRSGARSATIGAGPHDRFEVGSISKGLTGMLLEIAIQRGEVTAESRVGKFVDLGASPVGQVTLAQLATHTSGLPPIPPSGRQFARSLWWQISGASPYGTSTEDFLRDVARAPLDSPPGTYSNCGFQLLGLALGRAAGTPYPQLLRERVLDPLGMHDTTVPLTAADLDDLDLPGDSAIGTSDGPWLGEPVAPAGGARSSAHDMTILLQALLDGSAPGVTAMRPRVSADGQSTGWAWVTSPDPERGPVVWHNGITAGFTSMIALDTQAGRGVVVLAARSEGVEAPALDILRNPQVWP